MRLFTWSKKDGCAGTGALISGYLDGKLGPGDRFGVERHLEGCSSCRKDLESLRATVALLHRLPEVAPPRRFAVSGVRPRRAAWAMPALRYATAAVVVLLGAALAVDQADVLVRQSDTATSIDGPVEWGSSVGAYWAVNGVRNSIGSSQATPAVLLVPDGTDNASAAVASLSGNGTVYGSTAASAAETARVVLLPAGDEAPANGEVKEFMVAAITGGDAMLLAPNDAWLTSALAAAVERPEGSYLRMVSSDYADLYWFDLADSERVAVAAPAAASGDGWLRPVEYALVALAGLLGMAAAGLWLWRRRERLAEVKVDQGRP